MVVVNESYPSECIQFRSILNHSQLRFRVDGMTPVRQQSEPAVLVSQDTNSRPSHEKPNQMAAEVENSQKPDRGNHSIQQDLASQSSQPCAAGQVALPQNSRQEDRTPPNSLDAPLISTIPESDPQELMDQSHKDVAGGQPIQQSNWERDALDDIIDEAKATSHLVSQPITLPGLKKLSSITSLWISWIPRMTATKMASKVTVKTRVQKSQIQDGKHMQAKRTKNPSGHKFSPVCRSMIQK